MNREPLSGRDWVAAAFPLDGPFTPESVIEAGRAAAELVRYLAHATHRAGSGRLRFAPDVYPLLGALASAAHSLDQVCQQVTDRLAALITDPTLRADEMGPPRPAVELAARAAEQTSHAALACAQLAGHLNAAQAAIGRLYHHLPPDDDATGEDRR